MFTINEDNSIYITRGDVMFFSVTAKVNGENYIFRNGDVIRFKVYGKKDVENVVLRKDFAVEADTDRVNIYLTESETKIGEPINKPVDYWYEVVLNPFNAPQTLIGYDEDGAKIFKLFPEGVMSNVDDEITEEDIPVVDENLDMTSTRPVQNQAITRAWVGVLNLISEIQAKELPTASKEVKGGVIIGDGLAVDENGKVSVDVDLPDIPETVIPTASKDQKGCMIVGDGLTVDENGRVSVSVDLAEGDLSDYVLPTASATVKGGVKVGDGLEIDGDGVLSAVGSDGGFTVVSRTHPLQPSSEAQVSIGITNPDNKYYVYCMHVRLVDQAGRDVAHTMFGFYSPNPYHANDINKPAVNEVKLLNASISQGLPNTADVVAEGSYVRCKYDLSGDNIGSIVSVTINGWYKVF